MKTIATAPLSNSPNTTHPRIGKKGGKVVQVATRDREHRIGTKAQRQRISLHVREDLGSLPKENVPKAPGTDWC